MDTEPKVRLKSSDKVEFKIPIKVAKSMSLIGDLIDSAGAENCSEIPLKFDADLMEKVLDFANHASQAHLKNRYIEKNKADIFSLLDAANFLGYEDLLQTIAKHIADSLNTKTVEELRTEFGITEDEYKDLPVFPPESMETSPEDSESQSVNE